MASRELFLIYREIRIRCKKYWKPLCLQLCDGPAKITRITPYCARLPRGQRPAAHHPAPGYPTRKREAKHSNVLSPASHHAKLHWHAGYPHHACNAFFRRGKENPLVELISASKGDLSTRKNGLSVKCSLLINSLWWCWRLALPWLFILCYSVSAMDKPRCRSFKPYFSKRNVHSAAKLVFVINNI